MYVYVSLALCVFVCLNCFVPMDSLSLFAINIICRGSSSLYNQCFENKADQCDNITYAGKYLLISLVFFYD